MPQNARGNIDPETLDLYVIAYDKTILKAKEHQAKCGVKRDIREVIISELTYVFGYYTANLLTDFAYSDYNESSVEKLRKILMKKDPEVKEKSFQTFYGEQNIIEGRLEGIAFFSQLKVLENYRIDKRFEEIIFPEIYEKILRSYVREASILNPTEANPTEALYLLSNILKYSTKVVGFYFRNLLNEMSKPERRDFVLKKLSEITKEEIETTMKYLTDRGKVRIFFSSSSYDQIYD